jgi:SynChlorMet cassette protein ScmC
MEPETSAERAWSIHQTCGEGVLRMPEPHAGPLLTPSYSLRLADGGRWRLVSCRAAAPWLKKLAGILGLGAGHADNSPIIAFVLTEAQSGNNPSHPPASALKLRANRPRGDWEPLHFDLLRFWRHRDCPHWIGELGIRPPEETDYQKMWRALQPCYRWAVDSGGLPFHAALVEWNGLGLLLAGPGNAGKSTCCRRWPQTRQVLCDDESLVVVDSQGQLRAHPLPTWSDYLYRGSTRTWCLQQSLPLGAVFFLEQAVTNAIRPLRTGHAAVLMAQSAEEVFCRGRKDSDRQAHRQERQHLFAAASRLSQAVPSFLLRVSQEGAFWEPMERVLAHECR